MKVEVKIFTDIKEPYAIIYSNSMTKEVQEAIISLEKRENVITVTENEKIIILQSDEIYMVRTENSEVMVYCKNKSYLSKKRLYEIATLLGNGFMQISKAVFVNLKQIDSVEPYFNGVMNLKLKNGCSEYISRKYLPQFKKYLGI